MHKFTWKLSHSQNFRTTKTYKLKFFFRYFLIHQMSSLAVSTSSTIPLFSFDHAWSLRIILYFLYTNRPENSATVKISGWQKHTSRNLFFRHFLICWMSSWRVFLVSSRGQSTSPTFHNIKERRYNQLLESGNRK